MTVCGQRAGLTALSQRFLVVTIGARVFALAGDSVEGLLTVEEAGEAEGATAGSLTYETIDLAGRLALSPDVNGPDTRIVLLAQGGVRGSIRASQVHGLTELERSQVFPIPSQFQNGEQDWYQGMILFKEGVAMVLDTAWVLNRIGGIRRGDDQGLSSEAQRLLSGRPDLAAGKVREC